MFGYSSVPFENSLKISIQERITDDLVVNHNYFVEKEAPSNIHPYHFQNSDSLLEVPIEQLLENISKTDVQKPAQEEEDLNEKLSRPLLQDFDKVDNNLWSDKYQVHKYSELATDDHLNRESLLWLLTWNEVVFKYQGKTSVFGPRPEKAPLKPVLLISGPPGSGKTTLAKIISTHFNYSPHEINCALLGAGKELLDTLRYSLSIKTVSGKPTILILDQVESLDKATIKSLCELFTSKTLKRPTVVITNNMYAASLYELRKIALIQQSRLLNTENLYVRLKEIIEMERVYVPEIFLKTMIKENKSDIRACINSLQLLGSARGNKQLNVDSITMKIAGIKEASVSIYEIWNQVFKVQNSNKIKKMILSYGDPDLINSGIFENYLSSKYNDYNLKKSVEMAESLCFNDVISTRIRENQQFELYTYQALPGMIANRICYSPQFDLSFPKVERKVFNMISENGDALNSLKCRILAHFTQSILMTDVFPYLPIILNKANENLSKEILLNLGFDFNIYEKKIIPDVKKILSLPKDFVFKLEVEQEVEKKESQIENLTSQKRKRDFNNGPIFVYHEGLTNAVKRKVRVIDLM